VLRWTLEWSRGSGTVKVYTQSPMTIDHQSVRNGLELSCFRSKRKGTESLPRILYAISEPSEPLECSRDYDATPYPAAFKTDLHSPFPDAYAKDPHLNYLRVPGCHYDKAVCARLGQFVGM
jgi:hypothetical protein